MSLVNSPTGSIFGLPQPINPNNGKLYRREIGYTVVSAKAGCGSNFCPSLLKLASCPEPADSELPKLLPTPTLLAWSIAHILE